MAGGVAAAVAAAAAAAEVAAAATTALNNEANEVRYVVIAIERDSSSLAKRFAMFSQLRESPILRFRETRCCMNSVFLYIATSAVPVL
jgi:hypothetical protein